MYSKIKVRMGVIFYVFCLFFKKYFFSFISGDIVLPPGYWEKEGLKSLEPCLGATTPENISLLFSFLPFNCQNDSIGCKIPIAGDRCQVRHHWKIGNLAMGTTSC